MGDAVVATIRPPEVPGVQTAGRDMAVTMVAWLRIGYQHTRSRSKSPRAARVFARCMLATWWPSWPLLYVVQWLLLCRRHARYYLSGDRTAILAVVAGRNGWTIEDHLSCQPGKGHGERLRDALIPSLVAECDRRSIAICAATAIPRLTATYMAAVPGLRDVGRAFPRGRRLRRKPQRTSDNWREGR